MPQLMYSWIVELLCLFYCSKSSSITLLLLLLPTSCESDLTRAEQTLRGTESLISATVSRWSRLCHELVSDRIEISVPCYLAELMDLNEMVGVMENAGASLFPRVLFSHYS